METNEVITSGRQLRKLLELKSEPVMEKYGLRMVELDILALLAESKYGDTAREIKSRKQISKAHVSKSVDNLKAGGLIKLEEDEADHRLLHIRLTERAHEIVREEREIYEACRALMLRNVTEEELKVMDTVMRKIIENLNAELCKKLPDC